MDIHVDIRGFLEIYMHGFAMDSWTREGRTHVVENTTFETERANTIKVAGINAAYRVEIGAYSSLGRTLLELDPNSTWYSF